jgi:hypothetical protein
VSCCRSEIGTGLARIIREIIAKHHRRYGILRVREEPRFVSDSARAGSSFKTLKAELETLDGGHSAAKARQAVFLYIEAYYNRVCTHSD